MRTKLESGAWVEHTPVQDIKGKHIRAMGRVGRPVISRHVVDDEGQIDIGLLVEGADLPGSQQAKHDALWAMFIDAWSFEVPVPVLDYAAGIVTGAESLDEIPGEDYLEIDKLLEAFSKKLAVKPDPKGVTTSGSSTSSRASAGHGSRRG